MRFSPSERSSSEPSSDELRPINLMYHQSTLPSARRLADTISHFRPIILTQVNRPDYFNVSWGLAKGAADLNSPSAVALACRKDDALRHMERNGVSVPRINDLSGSNGYPMIARRRRHRGGHGLWLCQTPSDVVRARSAGASYGLEFIEDALEFRVHVFKTDKYRSIKLQEKLGGEGYVRNHRHGWLFLPPLHRVEAKLARKEAKKAVEALGLDFGAVDVLVKDGKAYVLEVNTAPALTDLRSDTIYRYAAKIISIGVERSMKQKEWE